MAGNAHLLANRRQDRFDIGSERLLQREFGGDDVASRLGFSQLFQIHREQFYALLQHHINITKNIIQTLCLRLRQANFSINSLAHLDVSGRLARFLIDQAGAAGTRKNDWVVIARLTHQEIAGRIATSRETVSRLLKQLEGSGCILCRRDGLYIHTRFLT